MVKIAPRPKGLNLGCREWRREYAKEKQAKQPPMVVHKKTVVKPVDFTCLEISMKKNKKKKKKKKVNLLLDVPGGEAASMITTASKRSTILWDAPRPLEEQSEANLKIQESIAKSFAARPAGFTSPTDSGSPRSTIEITDAGQPLPSTPTTPIAPCPSVLWRIVSESEPTFALNCEERKMATVVNGECNSLGLIFDISGDQQRISLSESSEIWTSTVSGLGSAFGRPRTDGNSSEGRGSRELDKLECTSASEEKEEQPTSTAAQPKQELFTSDISGILSLGLVEDTVRGDYLLGTVHEPREMKADETPRNGDLYAVVQQIKGSKISTDASSRISPALVAPQANPQYLPVHKTTEHKGPAGIDEIPMNELLILGLQVTPTGAYEEPPIPVLEVGKTSMPLSPIKLHPAPAVPDPPLKLGSTRRTIESNLDNIFKGTSSNKPKPAKRHRLSGAHSHPNALLHGSPSLELRTESGLPSSSRKIYPQAVWGEDLSGYDRYQDSPRMEEGKVSEGPSVAVTSSNVLAPGSNVHGRQAPSPTNSVWTLPSPRTFETLRMLDTFRVWKWTRPRPNPSDSDGFKYGIPMSPPPPILPIVPPTTPYMSLLAGRVFSWARKLFNRKAPVEEMPGIH